MSNTIIEAKKFQRCIEDFSCENCGSWVKGNGYTNHCPHCLHSKHVDINPGDRAASCKGLMIPICFGAKKKNTQSIIHECQKCGHTCSNKISKDDSLEYLFNSLRATF